MNQYMHFKTSLAVFCALFLYSINSYSQTESDVGLFDVNAVMPTNKGGENARLVFDKLSNLYDAKCSKETWPTAFNLFIGASDISRGEAGRRTREALTRITSLREIPECEQNRESTRACLRAIDLRFGGDFRSFIRSQGCSLSRRWQLNVVMLSCNSVAQNFDTERKDSSNKGSDKNSCHYLLGQCGDSSLRAENKNLTEGSEYGLRCKSVTELYVKVCLPTNVEELEKKCELADANGFYKQGFSRGIGSFRVTTDKPVILDINSDSNSGPTNGAQ